MNEIYTIGFTKKSAKLFFDLLKRNEIEILIDVRLNNTSQLAGFSKYPDIEYFLESICSIHYISDISLAPEEWILKDYKSKKITWEQYVDFFNELMKKRDIEKYIKSKYEAVANKKICLLCSEEKPEFCHRLLVAGYFEKVFGMKVKNL